MSSFTKSELEEYKKRLQDIKNQPEIKLSGPVEKIKLDNLQQMIEKSSSRVQGLIGGIQISSATWIESIDKEINEESYKK